MATVTREQSTDDRLIFEFGQGDVAAAEELFDRFSPKVYGVGVRMLHDADLAATFVEETFVKLRRRASHYPSSCLPLDAWVLAQALGMVLRMSGREAARGIEIGSFEEGPMNDPFGLELMRARTYETEGSVVRARQASEVQRRTDGPRPGRAATLAAGWRSIRHLMDPRHAAAPAGASIEDGQLCSCDGLH